MDTTKHTALSRAKVSGSPWPTKDWPNKQSDARIIEAMVHSDELPPRLISSIGAGEEAIRARAREIGLSKEFIKKCRLSGSRPGMRACVQCDTQFLSSGVHNRLCPRCPKR